MRKVASVTLVLALVIPSLLVAEEEFSGFTEVHDPNMDWSFGWALAVSGDTLAVGNNHYRSGSVWIFERMRKDPDRFKLAKRLTSPMPEDERYFGRALAIDGDTLVVNVGFSDSVLIFSRDHGGPGAWGFVRKFEKFGDVAIDGNLLAIGVDGERVDIHQRDLGGVDNWGRLSTVRPEDSDEPFAASVSISGGALAVGSAFDACGSWTDVCSDGYRVFEQSDSDPADWKQVLHIPGKGFGDATGYEVLVDSSTLVSTDGIRERRHRDWELVAPAPTGPGIFGLALRQHSVAHGSTAPGGTVVVLDRAGGSEPAWHRVDKLEVEIANCGHHALGPRELVVACPHGDPAQEFGTVRIYPREPLFSHSFESPRLSRWNNVKRRVRLTSPGLDGSNQALAVDLDGGVRKSFVRARKLDRAPSVSLEFSLLPNRARLGDQTVDIVHLSGTGRRQVRLTMTAIGDKYGVDMWVRRPGIGFERVGGTRIASDRATRLGIEWQRATGPLAADGVVRLKKRGRVVAELQDLATDQKSISVLTLGLPGGSRGTGGGAILFDSVAVHR